ncbi:MAG: cyclohexanone monooxygenase, partial [Gammaproteobacteria bacterium]|nr:cyclohexanone monooxygenase [Gammaproteobacteria bacterium]
GFEWSPIYEPGEWQGLSAQQRRDTMESLWADGSLRFWVGACEEVLSDEAVNAEFAQFVRDKIRARIHDPALAEKLLPRGLFGISRVPLENGYFEVFNRDNVELVDVRDTPIERFSTAGLMVAGREYPLDVVVLATGFDAGTGALTRIDIRGRDGISLAESWHRDLRSTMGLQVHGFPNMFTVSGPLAPASALCNASTCLQQQVDWVRDCLVALRNGGNTVIEPSAAKEAEWVSHHDELVAMSLFTRNNSWYTGANVEGKPRRFLAYPGGVDAYWQLCDDLRVNGYPGFDIS